ncbi:MAG TPA: PAS-domain containing protein, partial [Fimbriimonadaceae bacterium]|nr:PAS-domain containing protein [Fimbriimonadaceae bacterium]
MFGRMQEGFFIGEAIRDATGHMHDFRFVEVNPAFEAITGLSAKDVVGHCVREAIPGIQDNLIATYEQVVSTGLPTQFEVHVPALGGRWYEARASAKTRERFTVLFLDITARKLAEAKAQEKAELLEATLHNMDQGLIMVDAEETIRVYNRRALELLDLPEHLMQGSRSYEAVKRFQRERGEFVRSDERQRQWLNTGDFLHKEVQYERERPNGTVLEVRSVPLSDGGAVRTYTDISPRRKAEAALRESEARFKDFAEVGSDWFWETDADLRYVEVAGQPLAVSVIGRTRWEAAGADPDSPEWKAHVELVRAHQPFRHFEFKALLNGETYYLSSSGRPLFDAEGVFRGYRGVTANVTARKAAELLAAEKSAMLEATLENMDQGLIMYDASERVQIFNTRVTELFDVPVEFLAKQPTFRELIQYGLGRQEFRSADDPFLQQVMSNPVRDTPSVIERERPNGTTLEVRTVPLPNGGVVRTYADVTARKAADAAIRRNENWLRTLTEAMPALVFTCDQEGRCEYTNPQYQGYTGLSADELLGDGWSELL